MYGEGAKGFLSLKTELIPIDRYRERGDHCLLWCNHQAPLDSSDLLDLLTAWLN